ncbi:MAG: Crp/Fnr family transcriptional regulator [Dehalococcoidales bacterium]|nr:Crp/Fnr family transcriptional regulator [Dehalococcoidales bacterium]
MKSDEKAAVLERSFIFSGLDDEDLSALSGLCIDKSFIPGEFIFWDEDPPEWFYIIAEGQVKVVKHSSSGKEFIIAFFGIGEVFGEVAVFENNPYPASAQAVGEVRVIGIRRQDFSTFLASRPQVALRIINVLGGRLRNAQDRLRDFAGERVEQRLAGVLLMLSNKLGSTLPFTRQEIADMVGTTTETVIRLMSIFRERGVIRSTRGKIIIQDRKKLKLLREGPPEILH